ncbi:MAG: bacteriophage abortive infection AbiH family protein [Rhodobacteraceae bacterium]|nr:bacteriophage abortive infection AbiH family protein [Paracoccaceae bacterium]
MSELVVVGNGFDLHHGLQTSYGAFAQFAKNHSPGVYNLLSELFLASHEYMGLDRPDAASEEDFIYNRWCDFESCLGLIDGEEFGQRSLEDISEYMEELGMEETLVDEFIENIASVLDTFRDWVADIDLRHGRQGNFNFAPASMFLNFNYTETLETFYGIDIRRINYIHGSRTQPDHLIVGHDESPPKPQSKHDLPDFHHNPFYAYLRKTQKPIETILPELSNWLDGLLDVELISVRGHSLGSVDWPYFHAISRKFPTADWSFSYYDSNGLGDIRNFVRILGISSSKILSVATLTQFERDPVTRENALNYTQAVLF